MPITSIADLRRTAPPELQDLDDRALISAFSQRSGIDQSELLSYFGVRPAGTLGEMGRQGAAGLISDIPRMVGKGMQAFSAPGESMYELGGSMATAAERRGLGYEYDPRGRGLGGEILAKGARALPPVVPAIGAAFLPGGQVLAPTVAAGLYGPSAYQESYEKLREQGVSEEAARSAALGVGLTKGVGEAAVSAATFGLLRPAAAALRSAPRTTAGVAQAMTDTSVLRPLAKAYGANLALQPATEVAQDVGSALIEEAYGATPEDKLAIARESAVGGFGLAVLLGPLQAGTSVSRSRRAQELTDALNSPDAATREQARNLVVQEARRQGVSEADTGAWFEQRLREDMEANAALQQEEQSLINSRKQQLLNGGATTEQADEILNSEVKQPDFWQRMSELTKPTDAINLALQDPELARRLSPQDRQKLRDARLGGPFLSEAMEILGRYRPTPAAPITDQTVDLTQPAAVGLQPAVPTLLGGTGQAVDLTQPPAPMPTRAPLPLPPGVAPVEGAPGVMELAPPLPTPAPPAPAAVETQPPLPTPAPPAPAAEAPAFPAPVRTRALPSGSNDSVYVGTYTQDNRPVEMTVRRDPAGVVTGVFMTQKSGERQVRFMTAAPASFARVRAGRSDQEVIDAAFGKSFAPKYTAPVSSTGVGTPSAPVSPPAATPAAAPGESFAPAAPATTATAAELPAEAQKELGDLLDNLEARISSEPGVATGRVTLPQSVLAGLSRMVRTSKDEPPVAYVPKTVQPDAAATAQYAEQMTRISQAADEVIAAADTLYNAETNLVPTESKAALQQRGRPRMTDAEKDARADEIAADALRNVTQLRIQLKTKIDALREAAGTDRNVEAIVAVTKAGSIKSRRGKASATQSDLTSRDVLLSSAWARYKEGALDEAASADMTRGTPIRKAYEAAKSTVQPLVDAATTGRRRRPNNKTEIQSGFLGVMAYIQLHGTGFERLISAAINKALSNPKLTPPTLKWIGAEATPYYDPAKNEVGIHETASPEQALHEGLHAALQWYVYQNPSDTEVLQLEAALKRVLDYKGDMSPKAAEVIDAIRKVYGPGKTKAQKLDAVLELISYGTTLRDFRNLLKQMESAKTVPGLLSGVSALWKRITALVQRFLGVSNSIANDVLDGTVALLEQAATAEAGPAKRTGKVLQAAVQSNTPAPQQAPNTSTEVATKTDDQLAKEAGFPDLRAYRETKASSFNLTRLLFERMGFGKDGTVDKAVQKRSAQAANIIRKEFPLLEKALLNINSRFGQSVEYKRITDFFKLDALTGVQEGEAMMRHLYSHPKDAAKVFRYLNGDATALADSGKDAVLRRMGDNIRNNIQQYITTLPAAQQKLFAGLKFTDYLINPEGIADLAGKSLGVRTLRKALKREVRTETNIDAFKQYLSFKDGVMDSDAGVYQIMETLQNPDGTTSRVPVGFISTDKANDYAGLDIDRSRIWFLDKPTKEDARSFRFVTRQRTGANLMTLADQLSSGKLSTVEADDAVQQLSAAVLTTLSALGHNYAATNMFRGLAQLGRGDDGAPTASSVVFDNEAQIKAAFPDRQIKDILDGGSEDAKTGKLKSAAQRTGVWVRLPKPDSNTQSYGVLAGKLIPGTVWSNLHDMADRTPLMGSEALNTIMTTFKKAKTVYSLPTHANNILSNYSLMLLHGISHKTLKDAASLFYRHTVSPKSLSKADLDLIQAFYNSGAVLGQYTNTEAKSFIAKKLADSITPDADKSMFTKLAGLAKFEQGFAERLAQLQRAGRLTDNFATELYGAGDNVFRLAAFMHTAGNVQFRDNTTSLNQDQMREVGLAARKMFLDYDIDARWVRAARQSILPFVSWSYAIAPVLGRIAIHRPWTMVNMMSAIGLMNALMDGDDAEWRRTGPEQVREKSLFGLGPHMYMRMPFGDDENPVYWNIGKSVPMMSLLQPPMGETKLLGQDWIPGFLTPSGPYVTLIALTFLGIDPFTGKPMYNETDTQWDKLTKAGEAVYNTMAPPALSSKVIGPESGSIAKFARGDVGPTGQPPDAMFLARMMGLTLYEFNRSETQFYQDAEVKKIKREFGTVMNKLKRDEYNKGYPDFEKMDQELADLKERLKQRIAEIRGEEQ